MASFFGNKSSNGAACPICGGTNFFNVPVGRADTWATQVESLPQWKRARGLPENAGVAFSEPRLEWDQPTFDRSSTPTSHTRCGRCASLIPPQFLAKPKERVLLITTGMPQAGKTTWLKCLFQPSHKKHLIAEGSSQISREPYVYIEPYTIANPDPRTAVPILLHGMELKFQRERISIAGIDIKGEVFHQRTTTPDKYMRVLSILKNLRALPFAELFVMFVVPFDPTLVRPNIGQLTSHLTNEPGSRGSWQGVIWTHLDRAQLKDSEGLYAFLASSPDALAMARRVVAGEDAFDSKFMTAAADIEQLVRKTNWTTKLELLESLTWLLYRIMIAYTTLPARFGIGNTEFYYSYMDGLGSRLVAQCMRLASTLFSAWDGAGRGDFGSMIRESMIPGAESRFPVLPCGLEFLRGADESQEDGIPVWGDLLLLEILRRHV